MQRSKVLEMVVRTLPLLLTFFHPVTGLPATYYVAPDGSNNNSGSISQPLLTIAAGVRRLAAGDTLIVRGGTYVEAALDDKIASGSSWSAPVAIQASPGETVVFQPTTPRVPGINIRRAKRFIRIDGLTIDMARVPNTDGLKVHENSSDVELLNLDIKNVHGKRGCAITVSDGSERVVVRGSKLHDIFQTPPAKPGNHGLYWRGKSGLIEWNQFYNIQGYGIQLYTEKHVGVDDNIVRYNVFYNVGQPALRSEGGIAVYSGVRNKIYGNLIYNSYGSGIVVRNNDNELYNNTIYGAKVVGIDVETGRNNTVINNIAYGNGENLKLRPPSTISSHNLTSDPSFVDAAAGDFRLRVESPAIGKGKVVPEVKVDLDRLPRAERLGYDIGAYQHTGR